MDERLAGRDIVLIGAGHTNMHIVRMWRMKPIPDTRLTLISPFSRATYSGMLPGTLAGLYAPEEMEMDLYRFALPAGVRVIIDKAVGLDPVRQQVLFQERAPVHFDVASVGVGSVPLDADRWRDSPAMLPIKPMATFRHRLQQRLDTLVAAGTNAIRVAVVGGGPAGVEVTLCLEAFLRSQSLPADLSLIESGQEILTGYLAGTVRRVKKEFTRRGVRILPESRVSSVNETSLAFTDGNSIDADIIVWATGAVPSPMVTAIPLAKAQDGFLAVRNTLQSVDGHPVFAVGDAGTLIDCPVRKAGVYAVREGPILWENLQRYCGGRSLKPYEPQTGFLSLLADGTGRSFLNYKNFSAHGRWAWHLKDYIDRRFMRMYHEYTGVDDMVGQEPVHTSTDSPEQPAMRCRGCGGKAGAGVLRAALTRLSEDSHDNTRPSHPAFGCPEDAAVIRNTPGLISVDFFQAFIDEPWLVGRIAALNALSDIQATGGQPTQALAMIQLPEGKPSKQTELLYQLLSGALHEFDRCGVELSGGHTTEGSELMIGFTVLGQLEDRPPLLKRQARPGDTLLLTKPLGTGVLLAGLPQARTRGEWADAMFQTMLTSNQTAAEVAREYGASAVTDITGFGLAGHLLEMFRASEVTGELHLDSIPLLPGARELLHTGMESTLAPANREMEPHLLLESSDLKTCPEYQALFDPQTAGGLVMALSPEHLEPAVSSLAEQSHPAFVIGKVTRESGNVARPTGDAATLFITR